jgi:hypothetical protein
MPSVETTTAVEATAVEATAVQAPAAAPRANWLKVLTPTVVDLLIPVGIFYLMRLAGFGVIAAGLAGGIVPIVRVAHTAIISRRRPDLLPLFMITALLAGTLAAVLMDSPRLALAKDGVITGLLGAWILITLTLRKPFMLSAGKAIAIAKRGPAKGALWAEQYDADPKFRHGIRLVTAVWGAVLVFDAVVRVVLAYSLPVDAVPFWTLMQWIALFVVLYTYFLYYAKTRDLLA